MPLKSTSVRWLTGSVRLGRLKVNSYWFLWNTSGWLPLPVRVSRDPRGEIKGLVAGFVSVRQGDLQPDDAGGILRHVIQNALSAMDRQFYPGTAGAEIVGLQTSKIPDRRSIR